MARIKRTLLGVVVAMVTIPLLAGVVYLPQVKATWSGFEARCALVEKAHAQEPLVGPMVRASTPGDSAAEGAGAWEAYMHALRTAGRYGLGCWAFSISLAQNGSEQEAERDARLALLDRSQPALRELRRSASATDRAFDLDWSAESWEHPWGVAPLSVRIGGDDLFFASVDLPNLASLHFREALAAGDPDAVEFLLDALQLSSDMASLPLLSESASGASSLVPHAWFAFGQEGVWNQLQDEALDRLIEGLDRVDAGLETMGDVQSVHVVLAARCFGESLLGPLSPGGTALRFVLGPLVEYILTDAVQAYGSLFELAEANRTALEAGGGVEPMQALDRLAASLKGAELYRDWAPGAQEIYNKGLSDFRSHTKRRLRGLARLRLLRRALYDLAGRDGGPQETRLGHPLKVVPGEAEVRYLVDHPFYADVEVWQLKAARRRG